MLSILTKTYIYIIKGIEIELWILWIYNIYMDMCAYLQIY